MGLEGGPPFSRRSDPNSNTLRLTYRIEPWDSLQGYHLLLGWKRFLALRSASPPDLRWRPFGRACLRILLIWLVWDADKLLRSLPDADKRVNPLLFHLLLPTDDRIEIFPPILYTRKTRKINRVRHIYIIPLLTEHAIHLVIDFDILSF